MPAEVVGVEDVLKGLSFFDDDMYNRIKTVLGPLMRDVESAAKSDVPSNGEMLSGWSKPISSPDINYRPFPKYEAAMVKGGIGYKEGQNRKFKNGFQVENYVYNISAAGRIYETAGRKNPQGQPSVERKGLVYRTGSNGPGDFQINYYLPPAAKGKGYNNSANPKAGKQFIDNLNSTGQLVNARPKGMVGRPTTKETGRLIYRAWAEDNGRANAAVIKALETSAANFYELTKRAA